MSPINNKKAPKLVADYELHHCLGKGSMGKVKLAVHVRDRDKVAIKIVKRADTQINNFTSAGKPKSKEQILREKQKEEIREMRTIREAHIMMLLRHPHIVQLQNLYVSPTKFYIVMDYVNGGQLLYYIIKKQKLPEEQGRRFARQIISALDYLHRNSIVHRDLKIENIMIDKTGWNVKIIDFGLSNLYCPERKLTTYCGSLYFAAPELLRADPYDGPEVDVWSLGVVIYVMVTGHVPFDDRSIPGLHEKIKRGQVAYPSYLTYPCRSLLSKIFVPDPTKRIILQDIIRHVWINEGYTELTDNHMPTRTPVETPLAPHVVKQMTRGFRMGSEKDIQEKMELIIKSHVYRTSSEKVARIQRKHPSTSLRNIKNKPYDDPQSIPAAYHPLISIYHLTSERFTTQSFEPEFESPMDGSQPSFYDSPVSIRSEQALIPQVVPYQVEETNENDYDSESDSDDEFSEDSKLYFQGRKFASKKAASLMSMPDLHKTNTLHSQELPELEQNISTSSGSDHLSTREHDLLKKKNTKNSTQSKSSISQFFHKSTTSMAAAFSKLFCTR